MTDLPRLYGDLAEWWPLLSAAADYAEEAEVYRRVLVESARIPVRHVLELGSGGGNNASHLRAHFEMTLVDRSPGMLAVSRRLNPELTQREGDMRTVRLDRRFDAVFVHDAVGYLTTEDGLAAAIETARVHLRPGGVALFVPDAVTETFQPRTDHGGHDGEGRALRYLEWHWDPDPEDTSFIMDMVYVLRMREEVTVLHDRHFQGLFPTEFWLSAMKAAGLEPTFQTAELSDGDILHLFVGLAEAG